MSVFICPDKHIASLATWYAHQKALPVVLTQMIANELKRININSVNYQSGSKYRVRTCNLESAITIRADYAFYMANCLDYQSGKLPNPLLSEIIELADHQRDKSSDPNVWKLS